MANLIEHRTRPKSTTPTASPAGTATLYTVTVDTEEEWDWEDEYPTRNLGLQNIKQLPELQAVCDQRGAAVTYFVNHAVLAERESRRMILDLARHPRVEIGMHIHPWNTPPLVGESKVRPRDTFLHNLPFDLARAKLESVYSLFVEHGLRPTSFRGGRYSTSPVIQDFLRDHGMVADASVLPFSTWPDEGAPDHRCRRLDPVRLPPRRLGDPAMWEIPLTLAFTRRPFGLWHNLFEAVTNSPFRHLRLIGLAEKVGLVRKAWLNIETPLGRNTSPFLAVLRKLHLPSIDICLHSSSLVAGGNLFTRTQEDRQRVLTNLDETLACVSAWDEFRPATVTEVATHLEKHHACSGN